MEYQIVLTKYEWLMCDGCNKLKGDDTTMWFTDWDRMKDGSLAFTKMLCDECKNA